MTVREAAALAVLLLYALLCVAVWRRHRRRQQATRARAASLIGPVDAAERPLLVLHASQTGNAEHIAWQTAQAMHTAGLPVRLLPLAGIDRAALRNATHALVVASTHGEGDPPDLAAAFARQMMGADHAADLASLHYGLLALGDRDYVNFCGFGRALDAWLQRQGAQPLFDRIDVDKGDAQALQRWRGQLGHLAGTRNLPDWVERSFERWQVLAREHLNPGSLGAPLYHVELGPCDAQTRSDWQAGDLVQLRLAGDPRPREYSIASVPADGRVHLLVRRIGRASTWLTETAALGSSVELRLQPHPSFRIGPNDTRPLVLIGNGTGLAGLRAHLRTRAAMERPAPAWLVHGERMAAHDTLYPAEIESWRRAGWLQRVDRVFSRDQPARRHVQHLLADEAERLRDWVGRGAAIYVCGSLAGMARGVEDALLATLGAPALARLDAESRYRRDVY